MVRRIKSLVSTQRVIRYAIHANWNTGSAVKETFYCQVSDFNFPVKRSRSGHISEEWSSIQRLRLDLDLVLPKNSQIRRLNWQMFTTEITGFRVAIKKVAFTSFELFFITKKFSVKKHGNREV